MRKKKETSTRTSEKNVIPLRSFRARGRVSCSARRRRSSCVVAAAVVVLVVLIVALVVGEVTRSETREIEPPERERVETVERGAIARRD